MVDRIARALTDGGIVVADSVDGGTLYRDYSVDGANIAASGTFADSDYVLAIVGGTLVKVLKTDLVTAIGGPKIIRTPFHFGRLINDTATDATTKLVFEKVIQGIAGKTNTVVGLMITGCDIGATGASAGTTTVLVSSTSLGTGTSASISSSTTSSSYTTVNISLTTGAPLCYVRIEAAGYHSGVSGFIDIEVKDA